MKQLNKFYLSSFLKNQTYFTPVFILFLQFYRLTYTQIFWIYTIAAIASFILEIPTGIMADLIGKKKTMILARIFTLVAFLIYGFSNTFFMFIVAQVLLTIGDSFKSGTEVAYIFDYLRQKAKGTSYTEVKGKQKFWARIGEAIAASAGGFIAMAYGFNAVFFFAAVPALLNVFNMISYEKIEERGYKGKLLHSAVEHTKESLNEIKRNATLKKIIMNITIYTTIVAATTAFLQPYMKSASIPLERFGIIYTFFFILTAFAVRYSYILEKRFSKAEIINFITLFAIIPLLIIGFKFISFIGVFFFFLIIMGENIRSPIANHEFHNNISSERSATLGSVLMMSRNAGKAIFLPIVGYIADNSSLYIVMLIMAGIMFLNWLFFRIKTPKTY